ncbi:MAG: hypothetical protein ACKPE1_01730 [Dolichospermum sp.]
MTREQGTGNREQGNFTFRYLCRFFPFTYLIRFYLINKLRNMLLSLNLCRLG